VSCVENKIFRKIFVSKRDEKESVYDAFVQMGIVQGSATF
jgi:hypothetical protein